MWAQEGRLEPKFGLRSREAAPRPLGRLGVTLSVFRVHGMEWSGGAEEVCQELSGHKGETELSTQKLVSAGVIFIHL